METKVLGQGGIVERRIAMASAIAHREMIYKLSTVHRYFHRSVQHRAAVLGITETEAMDHLEGNHRAIFANKDGDIEVKLCMRSVDE